MRRIGLNQVVDCLRLLAKCDGPMAIASAYWKASGDVRRDMQIGWISFHLWKGASGAVFQVFFLIPCPLSVPGGT